MDATEKLTALAAKGANNAEIEAILQRALTDAELQIVRRARVAGRLRNEQTRARTAAERMAAMEERRAAVDIGVCANPERRDACKFDFPRWVQTYKPRRLPYSKDHLRVMARMQSAVLSGGLYVLACWRSFGKTMLSEDCAEWATLYGHKRFVLLIGATEQAAKDMAASILTDLEENTLLQEDFPEVCRPFIAMEGRPQRAASQTFGGEFLHAAGRSDFIQFPTIRGDEDRPYAQGQIIKTLGLTGRLRGLKHKTREGAEIRPDLAIPDDPQTDESAGSPEQCNARERLLTRAIAASGGPGSVLSVIMPCTVIKAGDLSSRFLDGKRHPEYMRECCGLVVQWPDAQETLWKEYATLRAEAIDEGDPRGEKATKFYADNRVAMDAGAVLSWPEWWEDGELSGLQHVQNMLIKFGPDGFDAECQNRPADESKAERPYVLDADIICSRVDATRKVLEVPTWVEHVVYSTDLNPSYGFSSAAVGFGVDQTAAVAWYGIYDDDPLPIFGNEPGSKEKQRFYEALVKTGKSLAALKFKPKIWAIDCSGSYFDTVIRFCDASEGVCGLKGTPFRGMGWKQYNTYGKAVIGTPREMCHQRGDEYENRRRRWIAWQVDYWGEVAQKAWLGSLGSPGSVSLFMGKHRAFAEQICSQRLERAGMGSVSQKWEWLWHVTPNAPHDFHDVIAQAYAAAAWGGIGTGGRVVEPKVFRRSRSVRHISV